VQQIRRERYREEADTEGRTQRQGSKAEGRHQRQKAGVEGRRQKAGGNSNRQEARQKAITSHPETVSHL